MYSQPIKRILLIAPHGSYRTFAFLDAAKNKGIEILIASEGEHSVVSVYAQGLHIKFDEPELAINKILHEAAIRPFTAVIATDDSTTELASKVSQLLQLPHNDPKSVAIAKRKDLARLCLSRAGVKIPRFEVIDTQQSVLLQIQNLSFPLVVKPIGLSASKGVIRVDSESDFESVCTRVKSIVRQNTTLSQDDYQFLIAEQFIAGEEIAVEGLLVNQEFHLLSIFDKPEPLNGPYFEETFYITPSKLNRLQQQQLVSVLQKACSAYGLHEGPVHAECRINAQGIWIIEIAARTIGGLCGRLLKFGTGMSLEELVLAHALGEPLAILSELQNEDLIAKNQHKNNGSGVLMIPIPKHGILKRIEGLLAAQKIPLIDEINIQIQEGYEVTALPEGASYLGFIFASGGSTSEVEQALRCAFKLLNIVIAPILFKAKVA